MKLRIKILVANIIYTLQNETAHFANNIGNLFSTVFYVSAAVLFINVLFSNIDTLAGYTKNEALFLMLVSQFSFYIFWIWTEENRELLHDEVKRGTLDFLLVRPVPALFYVSFRRLSIIRIIRDGLPNIAIIAWLVNWSALSLRWDFVLWGVGLFILGQIIWNCFCYLFVFPVFWYGSANNVYKITWALAETNGIPYEGLGKQFRITFSTIIPSFVVAAIPTSVMLGRSSGSGMFAIMFIVTIVFSYLKIFFWNLSLRNYTSAA